MSLALIKRNYAAGNWLRRFFWAHPEWWSLVLVALAWGALVSHAGEHHEHAHQAMLALDAPPVQVEIFNWCLMVVAMMVPIVVGPLRWVAFQSFRRRRHRAILLFLIGFLLPWLLLGGVAAWVRSLVWSHNPLLAPGLFGLAALWALAPMRARALVLCHITMPLAPSGWNANRDCLRFSLKVGGSCVATCGFLMLACAATGHNLVAMLGGAALGVLELRSYRPPIGHIFASALMLAAWFLLTIR